MRLVNGVLVRGADGVFSPFSGSILRFLCERFTVLAVPFLLVELGAGRFLFVVCGFGFDGGATAAFSEGMGVGVLLPSFLISFIFLCAGEPIVVND